MNQIKVLFFNATICALLLMTSALILPERKHDIINDMAFDMEDGNEKPDDFVILDSNIPLSEEELRDDDDDEEQQNELKLLLRLLAEQVQDDSLLYDNQVLPQSYNAKEVDYPISRNSAQERESFAKRSPEGDLLTKMRKWRQLNRAFNLHNKIRQSVQKQQIFFCHDPS